MAKKKTYKTKKKAGLTKSFEINIQPWEGIITSQDPYTIPDNVATWISGLPKLTGSIEAVQAPSELYNHTSNIKDLFSFQIGNNQYFCFLDGEKLRFTDNLLSLIASYDTTQEICDYTVQENQYVWVTSRSFLIAFDGSSIYNLTTHNITGDAICYWKGRIFIAKDRTIVFSVPNPNPTSSSNPFNTSLGAGAITITVGEFSKIYALIPKEDSIYIFTDRNIISLIGTTISNDPNQWYITEIVHEIGMTGVRKYIRLEHSIYFHTSLGIYKIIATVPEKIDDAISNLTGQIYGISNMTYKGIPYIAVSTKHPIYEDMNALLCYNILNGKWYGIDVNSSALAFFANNTYYASGRSIYRLFGKENVYLPIKLKSKTYYNLENTYFNIKDVVAYGRGASYYNFDKFTESVVYKIPKLMWQTDNGDIIVFSQTNTAINLYFDLPIDFWINVYKPKYTTPFATRVEEFNFYLEQLTETPSELVSLKVRGNIGGRYV